MRRTGDWGFNNSAPPTGYSRTGRDQYGFGYYYNTDSNYPSSATSMIPLDGTRGAYNPWVETEETAITRPFGFMSFPRQPMQLHVLDSFARDSAPRRLTQSSFQSSSSTSTQEDSKLSQDEQMKAIKKLKKEMYNPMPKRLSSRLCLYYRDQAANITNQRAREKEEDGKRCAICLEDFEPREMVMLTPCNHMFHEECIVPWVKSHGQCPVCRFALCDRVTGSNNIIPNLASNNDLLATDLISILRSMGAI